MAAGEEAMAVAVAAAAEAGVVGAIPRDYNFAADVLQKNLDAGRAGKPAYIDGRGTYTYGQLADRVARFGAAQRGLGVKREERVLIAQSPDLEHVVVSGENPHGYRLFEDVIGADEPEPYTAPTTSDDIAFWLYTSGSTGKPKGAVHVHASLKLTADLYGTPV